MTTPPLRDAHLHLEELGSARAAVHLDDCTTLHEVLERIARAAVTTPDGRAIDARSLRTEGLTERRFPTARELDDAAAGREVIVNAFDYHAMSVSSAVLAGAGISASTPDPANGVIVRDEHGSPAGPLLEEAAWLVRFAQPKPSPGQVLEHLSAAVAHLRSLGIAEAHDMRMVPRVLHALFAMEDAGELDGFTLLVYATPDHIDEVASMFAGRAPADHASVRFGGLKLFTDGTLNSRTAHMLRPFAEPLAEHPCGIANYTPEQLAMYLRDAQSRGWPAVATHCIGDAAVRAMLDAHDALERTLGTEPTLRLRIEHAQFVDEADIDRFGRAGRRYPIIASPQPCHLLTDIEAIERLVPDRAHRAFPLRDLIDTMQAAGRDPAEAVWLGSDAPIVRPDPADNRQAAVERRRPGMPEQRAIAPEQVIDEDWWLALQRSPIAQRV